MLVLIECGAILRMRNRWQRATLSLGLALALPLIGGIGAAQAQTASQITPPSFSPSWQRQGGGLVVPDNVGPDLPRGAERLTVRVGRVTVEGGRPELAQAAASVSATLSGRVVTAAEIMAAVRGLEQAYGEAGFALVRVVLPAQRVRDGGTLRLRVFDGVIERVDVSALPVEIRERVAALLAPLAGQAGLSLSDMERKLLLASAVPGTVMRSTLRPGSQPGSSVLAIEARYKPVTGFTGVDNTLAKSLGTYTASLGVDLNSPTGSGETLYWRAFGLPTTGGSAAFLGQEPRNRALSAGVILPLGADGLTLNLEATDARTAAHAGRGVVAFLSDFSRYSARLRYPVVIGREWTLHLEAAFDAQEERVDVRVPVSVPFSLDRLRVSRGSAEGLWYLPNEGALWGLPAGGVVTGRLTGSWGIDGLGAREAPAAGMRLVPLSRQGARPEFQKLEAALTYTQPVAEHLTVALFARGQTSFNQALARSEQIGLSNPSGLSAFDSGLFQGDEGFVTRGEVQVPFVGSGLLPFALPSLPAQLGAGLPSEDETPFAVMVSPYGFGAFGLTRQQRPTALERPVARGIAYGGGVRLSAAPGASFTNAAVTLEVGHADRSGRLPSDNRFTASVSLSF